MARRKFTSEFKQDAASLVLDERYSIRETCDAVGVGETALRRWVEQLASEWVGITQAGLQGTDAR